MLRNRNSQMVILKFLRRRFNQISKKNNLTEFKIKFPIEWYAYNAYFISRTRNIEDVLKIEHTQ